MGSNSFGNIFKYTTFGESHGPEIGCVIDGIPPGIKLNEKDIQNDLNKRRPGSSKFVTQRKEKDIVRISSGVFNNHKTLGLSSICNDPVSFKKIAGNIIAGKIAEGT